MKRLLVTRPEPAASRQAERLRGLGFDPVIAPLIRIEFLPAPELPLDGVQGLVVTSANALRALGRLPADTVPKHLPLYAVGEATAALARELGFADVRTGPGDAAALAAKIARDCSAHKGALLHLAGERLAFDMGTALAVTGHELRGVALYRAVDMEAFSGEARAAIEAGSLSGVLLMSPATAQVYARLVMGAGLTDAARALQYFCLSGAVADRIAGMGLRHVNVAATPKEDDLLALVSRRLAN